MKAASAARLELPVAGQKAEASLVGVAAVTVASAGALHQPPRALGVGVWAQYLIPSLSARVLADRREIADIIDHAVRYGDGNLDFRHASAAALQALPGGALKLLSRQITGVTLPARLDALPRCLIRLSALRSIDVADCKTAELDLTPWDLDTLTVTGATKLRWISVNEGTIVSCPAPGIRRKVCVKLFRDGQPVGHTAAGSRRYIKMPARRQFNMNGRYPMPNGELAYCRHIGQWWFGAREIRRAGKRSGDTDPASDMYQVLQSATLFQDALRGNDAIQDFKDVDATGTRNILVADDMFGKVVEQEFVRLCKSGLPATRQIRVLSVTHAMGLELGAKNGAHGKPEYSLVFYDPNVSATHTRERYQCMREVRMLRFSELFPRPDLICDYFGKQRPVVLLSVLDAKPSTKMRSLRVMLSAPERQCHFALDLAISHGFEPTSIQLLKELRATPSGAVDWKAFFDPVAAATFPRLYVAVAKGLPRIARNLLELAIRLSAEGLLEKSAVLGMLQQKHPDGASPITTLSMACESNGAACIAALTDVLVGSEADGLASPSQYEAFLRDGSPDLPSPYAVALLQDECSAAVTMVESMLRLTAAGRITGAQFVRLIECRGRDGVTAIERDFAAGETQVVVALMHPLLGAAAASLKSWEIAQILVASRADGTPALRVTYRARHADFLAAYGALVLAAVALGRIHALDAIAILLASRPGDTQVGALQAIAPGGEMLRVLVDLLSDPRIARWVSDDLSDGLDALAAADFSDGIASDIDPDSESSSLE
ncbi:MAG: secreted effector EspL [Herminiimonas sp.]|nr:secreted effector EspL [Herminiimonas sp.]